MPQIMNAKGLMASSSSTNALAGIAKVSDVDTNFGKNWNSRLEITNNEFVGRGVIVNVRLGLARLAGRNNLEGELWMTTAKQARKSGLFHLASPALAHARVAFGSEGRRENKEKIDLEFAKLKHDVGESSAALRMVGMGDNSGGEQKQYVVQAKRAKRASCSNTRRGNHKHFRTPRRGHHKSNEERSDEYCTRRPASRFRRSLLIIRALWLGWRHLL